MTEYQTVVTVLKFYHCRYSVAQREAHKKKGSANAEPPLYENL